LQIPTDAEGGFIFRTPPAGYEVPSRDSFVLNEFGTGARDAVINAPQSAQNVLNMIGDAAVMGGRMLAGTEGDFEPVSPLTQRLMDSKTPYSDMLLGTVKSSPAGLLFADSPYEAGAGTVGLIGGTVLGETLGGLSRSTLLNRYGFTYQGVDELAASSPFKSQLGATGTWKFGDVTATENVVPNKGGLAGQAGGMTGLRFPRTEGLGTHASMAELRATGALPGEQGVIITDRTVRFGDVYELGAT
jgi:hypothetical protein